MLSEGLRVQDVGSPRAREVKFRIFLWEVTCQAFFVWECSFCGIKARCSCDHGFDVVSIDSGVCCSELDRASPLDLWGIFMRVNGECALLPS